MSIGQRIRETQAGWPAERVAHAFRTAVYAVATAERLGREDLAEVRFRAESGDDADPVVRLARWFDAATYPLPAPLSPAEALSRLDEMFERDLVRAFREVQPLIQPVGLE